jgi:CheY-like chemotaxis protein
MEAERLSVLVVDDEEGVRNAVSRLLRHHGYRVSTANNGERAWRRLQNGEHYDCILLDLLMPHMSGRDLVLKAAKSGIVPLSRIVLLTAVQNVDNATAYLQLGCAGYCGKPYDNDWVLYQVRRVCGQLAEEETAAPLV